MSDRRGAMDMPMESVSEFDGLFDLRDNWLPESAGSPQPDADADDTEALEHTVKEHARNTLVEWMLGNRCTFACSYCPSELHDGSLPWISADVILPFLDQVRRHYCEALGR